MTGLKMKQTERTVRFKEFWELLEAGEVSILRNGVKCDLVLAGGILRCTQNGVPMPTVARAIIEEDSDYTILCDSESLDADYYLSLVGRPVRASNTLAFIKGVDRVAKAVVVQGINGGTWQEFDIDQVSADEVADFSFITSALVEVGRRDAFDLITSYQTNYRIWFSGRYSVLIWKEGKLVPVEVSVICNTIPGERTTRILGPEGEIKEGHIFGRKPLDAVDVEGSSKEKQNV